MNIETGISHNGNTRAVIYGVPGIGKTTLAATFPRPIFLDTEDGTGKVNLARVRIKSWKHLIDSIREASRLTDFETIVIDSIDWAEKMAIRECLTEKKVQSIEDIGAYGKGFQFLRNRFEQIIDAMQEAFERGKNIVLIGHSTLTRTPHPETGEMYEIYSLDLDKENRRTIMDWAEEVLFVNYEINLISKNGSNRKTAAGGERMCYAQFRPSFVAKTRSNLPDQFRLEDAAATFKEFVFPAPQEMAGIDLLKNELIKRNSLHLLDTILALKKHETHADFLGTIANIEKAIAFASTKTQGN